MRRSRSTAQQYEGECSLLNEESTRSLLNLFEINNISCTYLVTLQQYGGERTFLYRESIIMTSHFFNGFDASLDHVGDKTVYHP